MACYSYYQMIWIVGVNQNFSNMMTAIEAVLRPSSAIVCGAEHPDTGVGRTGGIVFSRTNPEGSGRPVHGYFTDVLRGSIVCNGDKADSIILGMPYASRGIGHIKFCG